METVDPAKARARVSFIFILVWAIGLTPPCFVYRFQQGGTFVFSGDKCVYRFYDPSTGVNAPFDDWLVAAGCEPLGELNQPAPVPKELK